jgi:hypothetical protein
VERLPGVPHLRRGRARFVAQKRDVSLGEEMKFKRRPLIYEATQWFPGQPVPGVEEVTVVERLDSERIRRVQKGKIQTKDGATYASSGDWIITGVAGEKYACKPEIFNQIYEVVHE